MPSTNRSAQLQPSSPESDNQGAEAVLPSLGSSSHIVAPPDEQTIISSHPPIPVEVLADTASDAAMRILQGRILPGDRLGHFELVQYVGGGGMGRVFRATDTRLARTVALKVLSPDQASDREMLLRFQNEAQSAARLDHDNIARVHYVGEDRGLHYIVFEFIEGVNIRELVATKGPLPLAEAISYTLQTAEALSHAAQRSVVHRDIKPSNLLITPVGQVKLIDMGLARLREINGDAADLTASGVTLGTFDYISPEQARDPRNADVRSDMYSLGCTFFFMLTGRPPFPDGTVLQKLLQHQGDQPPDVRQFRPDLPDGVTRVLRKAMAKDPRHRYGDPTEMIADLLALANEAGVRPWGPAGKTWGPPRQPEVSLLQRHLPWAAPMAALIAIVLFLNFLWSPPANREKPLPPPALTEPSDELAGNGPDSKQVAPSTTGGTVQASQAEKATKPTAALSQSSAFTSPARTKSARQQIDSAAVAQAAKVPGAPLVWRPGLPGGVQSFDPANFNPVQPMFPGAAERPAGSADDLGWSGLRLSDQASLPGLGSSADSDGYGGKLMAAMGPTIDFPLSKPAADAPPKRTGLLIVDHQASGENQFATLSAACGAATNGDVIELRFDGPREEMPIKLANLRVTIRAGEGCKPVIVFRPTDLDPVKYPRGMLTASGGRLTLINVALQMQVPREVSADNWSLVETRGDQTVNLKKCTLTIKNASEQLGAYHQDVAFFRVKSAPGSDAVIADSTAAATSAVTIELVDCIARGEAVLLRAEDLQPVRLTWENGFLATTECLLSAVGDSQSPRPTESLQVDLRHVTAAIRGGLCRITTTRTTPHSLPVQLSCADSILLGAGSPLLEQNSDGDVDDCRQRITWNGDRNCYDGFDVFWSIRRPDPESPPDQMMFDAWKTHWGPSHETLPQVGKLEWRKLPDFDRPVHRSVPADYALNEASSNNPALGTASDARNIGFQADRLPVVPPDAAPAAEKPAARH
jgi:serine/threonine-protein kinase